MPCLVLGDSLAVGIGAALPQCEVHAKVGITSRGFMADYGRWVTPLENGTVVVSLGANDGAGGAMRTHTNLGLMRERLGRSTKVMWVLPARPHDIRVVIEFVAATWGDRVVDTAPYAGGDGLHPSGQGYRSIARSLGA